MGISETMWAYDNLGQSHLYEIQVFGVNHTEETCINVKISMFVLGDRSFS